jgi:hypothetical protein
MVTLFWGPGPTARQNLRDIGHHDYSIGVSDAPPVLVDSLTNKGWRLGCGTEGGERERDAEVAVAHDGGGGMDCFPCFGVPANSAERDQHSSATPHHHHTHTHILPPPHKPTTLQTTPRLTRALRDVKTYVVLVLIT